MMPPLDLPQAILDMAEFTPVEDMLLAVLREKLPEIPVNSLIADDPPPMFIIARRDSGLITVGGGDDRFLEVARCYVHSFTSDPDGDEKGAVLSEAVRVALRDAARESWNRADLGTLNRVRVSTPPHRETDWATSTGPVQYADLPVGMWRYAASYDLTIRKPR